MKPLTVFLASLPVGGVLAAPTDIISAQGSPSPSLKSISFSGNGCPQGHAPQIVPDSSSSFPSDGAGDGGGLKLRFDSGYFRAVSAGSGSTRHTVNCQAHLNTGSGTGAGWQMSVSDVVVTGRAKRLEAGAGVRYYTTVFFSQAAGNTFTVEGQLKNTREEALEDVPVTFHATTGSKGAGVWGPCTTEESRSSPGIVNVNFRISLPSDGDNAFEVETERWDFRWRRC